MNNEGNEVSAGDMSTVRGVILLSRVHKVGQNGGDSARKMTADNGRSRWILWN